MYCSNSCVKERSNMYCRTVGTALYTAVYIHLASAARGVVYVGVGPAVNI